MWLAWTIARKDLRESVRDGRLLVVLVSVSLILIVAAASGATRAVRADTERAAAQQAERERWLAQGEVNPHAAAHYGTFVFAPEAALSHVDPGLTPYLPAAIFLEAHKQQLNRQRPVADALTFRRIIELSVAGCLLVVVPLLVVLLGSVAIARERERGTWGLLLAGGADTRAIVAGKALAVACGVGGAVGPALVVALAVSVGLTASSFNLDATIRGMLLGAAYCLYIGTWLALALGLSARSSSAPRALAAGLALWLGACVVAPPALMTVASALAPGPSVAAFTAALDDERASRPSWDDRVSAATDRFLNGEELPAASNPEVVALIDTEADDTELYGRHLDALAERLEQQERVYRRLSWLSPTAAMHVVSMTLAGTDYAHYRDFAQAAAAYRTTLLRSLNDDLAAFDSWKTFNAAGNRALWARIPEFTYTAPTVDWAIRHLDIAGAGLAVWVVFASGWLFRTALSPRALTRRARGGQVR